MAQDKQLPAIIFLEATRFDFHGGNIAGTATCVFPAEVVYDMEVKDRPAFRAHIQSFLQVNKISGMKILVVLSPAICFENLITSSTQLDEETTIKNFIDTVPFEEIVHRKYKSQKGNVVVAANASIINALKIELSTFGHYILAVVPSSVLGTPHNHSALDAKTAQYLSENALSLVSLDIATTIQTSPPVHEEAPLATLSRNRRLVVLLLIFLVLIIAMILMLKNAALL